MGEDVILATNFRRNGPGADHSLRPRLSGFDRSIVHLVRTRRGGMGAVNLDPGRHVDFCLLRMLSSASRMVDFGNGGGLHIRVLERVRSGARPKPICPSSMLTRSAGGSSTPARASWVPSVPSLCRERCSPSLSTG
jgi:hypothetical protein